MLLIEHDMSLVMGTCDRLAVLDFGQKISEGAPAEVRHAPAVIKAYLGESAPAAELLDDPEVRAAYLGGDAADARKE